MVLDREEEKLEGESRMVWKASKMRLAEAQMSPVRVAKGFEIKKPVVQ